MNARTKGNIAALVALAGMGTAVSSAFINLPEKPARVTRLEEIDNELVKPRYCLLDVQGSNIYLNDSRRLYQTLNAERDSLIEGGALEAQKAYGTEFERKEKKRRNYLFAGLAMIVPGMLIVKFHERRSRREEGKRK